MPAPKRRKDDPRQRAKAAIKRRLSDKKAGKPPKRPYPNLKTKPEAY